MLELSSCYKSSDKPLQKLEMVGLFHKIGYLLKRHQSTETLISNDVFFCVENISSVKPPILLNADVPEFQPTKKR